MKIIKKLHLSKEIITFLDKKELNSVRGGGYADDYEDDYTYDVFTSGCTDGCSPSPTVWRCTKGDCSEDCNSIITCLPSDPCSDINCE
jgi:hypothetical protein